VQDDLCLFTAADLAAQREPPQWPPQWRGYPAGPERVPRGIGEAYFTGPCLYASPARGLAARHAEFELWAGLFGRSGCAVHSHAWMPGRYGGRDDPLGRHEPSVMICDLRLDWSWAGGKRAPAPVPPCGHDGELLYRSGCRMGGCGWEGPERGGENAAVEDGMDHAWPGWRMLPPVPRVPQNGGTWKSLAAWRARVDPVYPAGWLESGGPIRTGRGPAGTRHVEAATPWGGYDLWISAEDAAELAR